MPVANLEIISIRWRFSSSDNSAGTRHLPFSFSGIPEELSNAKQELLFQVSPSMNGCEVNASASDSGRVSLPTRSRSKSTSICPLDFAVLRISKFLPVNDFLFPLSCLSPIAEITAMAARSSFFLLSDFDAKYVIPPAQISKPPSIPNFHALITRSLSYSSSGISW